jgi:hypothetical protein
MRLANLLIALAVALPSAAQYVPFPTDSAEWIVQRTVAGPGGQSSISFSRYVLDGDTTLNDTVYHKLYESFGTNPGTSMLVAGIREEAQKVYVRRVDYNGLPGNCQLDPSFEVMLYDFTLDTPGDSLVIHHPNIGEVVFVVFTVDSVQVNGAPRRRINFMNGTYSCGPIPLSYIEGVGSDRHVLDPLMWQAYENNYLLSCFKRSGAFHYTAFPAPPLCDWSTVGVAEAGREEHGLTAFQQNDALVVSAPGAHRVRLMDGQGRVLHTQVLVDGRARMAVPWARGTYVVQVFGRDGAMVGAKPVVLQQP